MKIGKDPLDPTIPIIVVVIAYLIVFILWCIGDKLGYIIPSVVIALIITGVHDWLGSEKTWFSIKGISIASIWILLSMLWKFFVN